MNTGFVLHRRVPNAPDGRHCVQACLLMALDVLGYPETLTITGAEEVTGFREGVETWPYTMLAWLGEHGFEVRHEDALDAVVFAGNPELALRRSGLGQPVLDYLLSITDVAQEQAAVARCVASKNVTFVAAEPDPGQLADRLRQGWLPLLALDATVLAGPSFDGFDGHMVIVTGVEDGDVAVVHDPGPPVRWDWRVPLKRLRAALRSPVESSGTITYLRPARGVIHAGRLVRSDRAAALPTCPITGKREAP